MAKHKFIYLVWLLPAYLLFLTVHQLSAYFGIGVTYDTGTSYTADVVEFDIKKIASQTNGYVVLEFDTGEGEHIRKKLSLPIEVAGMITDLSRIPVRYKQDAFMEIVMIPTYEPQKRMILSNAAMSFIGLIITFGIAWMAHRYAGQKREEGEQLIIERVDPT